jgi:hypothetical protein
MGALFVIMRKVLTNEKPQVSLAKDNEVVQTLSLDTLHPEMAPVSRTVRVLKVIGNGNVSWWY